MYWKILKSITFIGLTIMLGTMVTGQVPTSVVGNLTQASDDNIAPNVFETTFEAKEAVVDIHDGNGAGTKVYTFNGQIPGPQIQVKVGDTVIVHFTNSLPEATSIHWHGIEHNNASDGTPVSQNAVPPGGSFTYKFQVTRPGIFWYHPHFTATNHVFKGMYGPFIVTDESEAQLRDELHFLPPEDQTQRLILSDITVCKATGTNDTATFPAGGPWAGVGTFPGHAFSPTPQDLCENSPKNNDGMTITPLSQGTVPNVFPGKDCTGPGGACRVNEGQIVLVNGRQPTGRGGTPTNPDPLAPSAQVLDVKSGAGLRLQLINAAITRYFRLTLKDGTGQTVTLFRVGGEGGMLNRVRVEGGIQGSLDTKYSEGEILLAPSDRADVVINIPDGNVGDILTLWTQDYPRNGPRQGPFAAIPTVPILHLRINGQANGSEQYSITDGQGLRAHPAVNRPIENIKNQPITDHLLDPTTLSPVQPGTANEEIQFTRTNRPSIDGIAGTLHTADPGTNFTLIPHLSSSRYARVGDLLELKVTNLTEAHHPFHLHGFSFQPTRIEENGILKHAFDYEEFVDSLDIQPNHTLVFRVRIHERKMQDGLTRGGALGRWLFHCHILHHAELGKTSELVVLPAFPSLVWRNVSTGAVAVWLMNGTVLAAVGFPGGVPSDWQIAGVGDVNGDGRADVIWRNTTTGATAIWLMNGTAIASTGFPGGVPLVWQIAGVGDVNGDGTADVIWRHGTSGTVAVWLMNGITITAVGFPGTAPPAFEIGGVGDVDGDGKDDLVFRHTGTGATAIWLMNGTAIASTGFPGGVPLVWQIAGVGDVNGDGTADVIWRQSISGTVAVWLMNGVTVTTVGFPGTAPTAFEIGGVGDVDGDGKDDLVFRHTGTGATAIWLMNGTAIAASGFPGGVPSDWHLAQVGDVDGDGKADVIWRISPSGTVAVWLMNAFTINLVGFPGSAPLEWEIQ
jgi:FtsP/CotA-like multicopper oxidase with cupredoxin domain